MANKSISSAVNALDSQAALALTRTMDQVRGETAAGDRFTVILFVSFGAVALLLAAVGVHGLTAFSVAQRSHEIALWMALGATRSRVVASIGKFWDSEETRRPHHLTKIECILMTAKARKACLWLGILNCYNRPSTRLLEQ